MIYDMVHDMICDMVCDMICDMIRMKCFRIRDTIYDMIHGVMYVISLYMI